MIIINGEPHEAADIAGRSLSEYLKDAGYQSARVAVERNEEILPKDRYDTTLLEDGDRIEIVHFMGGGAR